MTANERPHASRLARWPHNNEMITRSALVTDGAALAAYLGVRRTCYGVRVAS